MRNHRRGVGVVDDTFELRGRMGHSQGHSDSAGTPDPPLDRDVLEPRWNEKGHTPLLEVLATLEKKERHLG